MESVGTTIRTARLEAGLSLDQVSANTCIPVKILQALEDDDFRQITSSFFYKSFVRQFCAQIGLPMEVLREPVALAASRFPDPLMPGQGETVIRSSLIRPLRKPRKVRWLYPALSLATVLVACSGFYAYWEGARSSSLQSIAGKVFVATKDAGSPASDSVSVPAIAQPKAVERTWLSIKADGRQVYAGTLEIDQKKLLEGRQEGQLRTGNAGGVNLVFNGKPIGLAGPHGTVRTVVFTRDNYQVLPDPAHTALNLSATALVGWLRLPPLR